MYARFKAQALQAFYKKCNRNFTASPDGCLLRLTAFKILVTKHESPHDQISLLVTEFEYLGLPQPPIGSPLALQERPGTAKAMHVLLDVGASAIASSVSEIEEQANTEEAPLSPASVASQVQGEPTGYTEFATQVAFPSNAIASQPQAKGSLLSLITKKPSHEIRSILPSNAQPALTTRDNLMPDSNSAEAKLIQGADSVGVQQGGLVKSDQQSHEADKNMAAMDKPPVHDRANSPNGEKMVDQTEGSQKPERVGKQPALTSEQQSTPSSEQPANPVQDDPWMNMTFPVPDLSVPKNQLAILSRPFSWYPAEPGKAFPAGNVPHEVLQWAEEQARHLARAPDAGSGLDDAVDKDEVAETGSDRDQNTSSTGEDAQDGNESEVSDEERLDWSQSSQEDALEGDLKGTIEPTPTMPSPHKPSPIKIKPQFPPDSSEPSPQSPQFPRRVEIPHDSDDDMLQCVSAEAQTDTPWLQPSVFPKDMKMDEVTPVHSTIDETFPPNSPGSSAPDLMPQSPSDVPTSPSRTTQNVADLIDIPRSTEEATKSQQQPMEQPHDPVINSGTHSLRSNSKTAAPSTNAGHVATRPHHDLTEAALSQLSRNDTGQSEALLSSGREQSQVAQTATRSSQGREGSPRLTTLQRNRSRYAVLTSTKRQAETLNTLQEAEQDATTHPNKHAIVSIQSTYPERSARKRKASHEGVISPPPKRAKHTSRYGFSQESPVPLDYRKENQRAKKEFLRQRMEEREPFPVVTDRELVDETNTSSLEDDQRELELERQRRRALLTKHVPDLWSELNKPHSTKRLQRSEKLRENELLAEVPDRNRKIQEGRSDSFATVKPNIGSKRQLPWEPTQSTHSTPKTSHRPTPSSSEAGTPRLSGWRQRNQEAFLASRRDSPLLNAASSLGPGLQQAPERSIHLSSQPVRVSETPRGGLPSFKALQSRLEHVVADGPVVDLHKDFLNLKSVKRDLGNGTEDLRKKHTKRWNVLAWTT